MPLTTFAATERIGEIAFDELDAVAQVALEPGGEVVDDAHAVAASDERFGNV